MTDKKYYLDDNPACKETYIQISVMGSNLKPSLVTKVVGIHPTQSYVKDELYETSHRTLRRKTNLWRFSTKDILSSTSLEKHAEYLLSRIENRIDALKNLVDKQGGRWSISIWWEGVSFHGGFTMTSTTLRKLACIGDEVHFYFISSDNEEDDGEDYEVHKENDEEE